jgi:hypothetical protein
MTTTKTLITRKDYMDGKATFAEYYGDVLDAAGVTFGPDHPMVLRAEKSTDEHYNDIPLNSWDLLAEGFRVAVGRPLRDRGDGWSLAGGVCLAKTAVRRAVESKREGASRS